jgi:tRNA pseudouridine38-40 synthase
MATYRLDISYDGVGFKGWARQPGSRTVQGELEEAIATLFGEPVVLTAAGRTDSGVHAIGQVASFATFRPPPDSLRRALNALTGTDLAINAAGPVADGFSARRDARSRRYRYRIETASVPSPFERGRVLRWPYELDESLLDRCSEALIGTHDFTAFTPTDSEHTHFGRTVMDAVWSRESADILCFELEADSFLRNMVRVLTRTILEVGSGRREPEEFIRLLGGATRLEAGETANPHGLYLLRVTY